MALPDHIPEGIPVYPGWAPLSTLTKMKARDRIITFGRPDKHREASVHHVGMTAMGCLGLPANHCWAYRATGPLADRYSPHPVHGEALPLP